MEDDIPVDVVDNNIDITHERQLLRSIKNNDLETVRQLLFEQNLSPNFVLSGKSPICETVSNGSEEILDLLLEANCSLDTAHFQDLMWRRRPIHLAASKGRTNIVKKLLDNGVDVNSRDDDERTPLHWSATYGQDKAAEMLICRGALVNIAQSDGFTPLHAATCLNHSNVCRVLLKNGAEMTRSDNDGWDALHTAVCYGHILVVKTLVEHGVDINRRAVTSDGNTYLHVAASSGHTAIGMLLVDSGFSLNDKNNLGYTPFHLAMYHNHHKFCKFLAQMGADIETNIESEQTPLYLASMRTDEKFIQLLLQSGYNFTKETWIHQNCLPVTLEKNPKLCQILHYFASNARSLRDLCIFRVRKVLGRDLLRNVNELPIPVCLKDSLTFIDN